MLNWKRLLIIAIVLSVAAALTLTNQLMAATGTPTPTPDWSNGTTPSPTPPPSPNLIPGKIEAESYYQMSGVTVEACSEGGYDVGGIDTNDWMMYPVCVQSTGLYQVSFRVASPNSDGVIEFKLTNGAQVLASITSPVPNTGGWQSWTTTYSYNVNLTAGSLYYMYITASVGGFSINRAFITKIASTPTPTAMPINLIGGVEAENYAGMSGVRTEYTGDTGGGLDVCEIDTNDWLAYSVNVLASDNYRVNYRVSSPNNTGKVDFILDGVTVASTLIPNTGGWQAWTTVSTDSIYISGSFHSVRLVASGGGWSLNRFNASSTTVTPTPTPVSYGIPGQVEAENYYAMSGVQTENCAEGGRNVGWIDTGDYMDYLLNVQKTGSYLGEFRVAGLNPGEIELVRYGQTLGYIAVPNTGGWQTWTTVSTTLDLYSGLQVLTIKASLGGWNLNWFKFTFRSGPTPTPTPEPLVKAQGYVYDLSTKKPIAGATVTLGNNTATTDSSGYYFIQNLYTTGRPTSVSLTVTAAGYETVTASVYVPIIGIVNKEFNLSPSTSTPTPTDTPTPTAVNYDFNITAAANASENGLRKGYFTLGSQYVSGPQGDGWVKVNYTVSGTATNGVDYQLLKGYVYVSVGYTFGQPAPELPGNQIDIIPLADSMIEGLETVTVTLSNGKSATLTIEDNPVITASQGKPASASSFQTGNEVSKGNDGNTSTRWAAGTGSFPQWWMVDLGAVMNLARVDINWYSSANRAYKYKIEASKDNLSFTTIADKTGNTVFGDTSDNVTAAARYVRITITGSSAGWASAYEFKVYTIAAGPTPTPYVTPTPTLNVTPTPSYPNLALNKRYYASTYNTPFPPQNAFDGDLNTRWESAYSDPQWIYADLGGAYNISRVVLYWETACGKSYQIQVSNDAATWTTVWSTTNGAGGVETIKFVPVSARYVRMYGTVRATPYGYSLWEFEVYQQ